MQAPTWSAALHAALRYVITSEITAVHKATLIEVLTRALRDHDAAELHRQASAQAGGEWQEAEILELEAFLQGRIASSWQHADECVMRMAAQLHRDPRSVRDKATQLGLGASVDYRFARTLTLGREE